MPKKVFEISSPSTSLTKLNTSKNIINKKFKPIQEEFSLAINKNNTLNDENNETIDEYCNKLRYQQTKLFMLTNKLNRFMSHNNSNNHLTIVRKEDDTQMNDSDLNKENNFDHNSFERQSKHWNSTYSFRDSIRNLTACVSNKSSKRYNKNYNNNLTKMKTSRTTCFSDLQSYKHHEHQHTTYKNDLFKNIQKQMSNANVSMKSSRTEPNVLKIALNETNDYDSIKLLRSSTANEIGTSFKPKLDSKTSITIENSKYKHLQQTNKQNQQSSSSSSSLKQKFLLQTSLSAPLTHTQTTTTTTTTFTLNTKPKLNKIGLGENDLCEMIDKKVLQQQQHQIESSRENITKLNCNLSQEFSATRFVNNMLHNNNNNNNNIKLRSNSLNNNSNLTCGNSVAERLEAILNSSSFDFNLYPMISLPLSNLYWRDGWSPNIHDDEFIIKDNNLHMQSSIKQCLSDLMCFKSESMMIKDHFDFYGTDFNDMPILLSYRLEADCVKVIFRTKEDNLYCSIPMQDINEPIIPHRICKFIDPSMRIKFLNQVLMPQGVQLLKNFDEHEISKTYKFGVVYMKKGQITEEELFSNPAHSETFEEFLDFIGERVKLKDFKGFKGGLDTQFGQTGDESVYEEYYNKEIMFHVSTLLPFNKNDTQQLERKRHIGNDIVSIIFQDESTPFAPDMIASNFLHSFIVIQKVHTTDLSEPTRYRVAVTSRHDVPNYSPEIPENGIFEKSNLFKDWLMLKLINAELACFKANKFQTLKTRTRNILLDDLYAKIHDSSQLYLQELNAANETCLNDYQTHKIHETLPRKLSDTQLDSSIQSKVSSSTNAIKSPSKSNGALNFFQTVKRHFTKSSSKSNDSTQQHQKQSQMIKAKENFSTSTLTLPHEQGPLPSNYNHRLRIRSSTVETPPSNSREFTSSLKDRNYEPSQDVKQKRLTLNVSTSNLKLINNKMLIMNSSEINLNQIGHFANSTTFDLPPSPISDNTDSASHASSSSSSKKSISEESTNAPNNTNKHENELDTGLGSTTPNSSGISSSTSFVNDFSDTQYLAEKNPNLRFQYPKKPQTNHNIIKKSFVPKQDSTQKPIQSQNEVF